MEGSISKTVIEGTLLRFWEKKFFLKEHACSSEEHCGGWVGSSTKMRQDAPPNSNTSSEARSASLPRKAHLYPLLLLDCA
jgi:hypothetical protein